jgi:tRNA(Ile)-lysidine synthase
MRGSGVDGLSAMPQSRPFGPGVLQRPLLEFQNGALRNYLHKNNIEWTEDPSNQCLDHDRNFIRHEVIPLLEKRWPEVNKRLLLSHAAMKHARHLLERMADNYLDKNLAHPFVLFITSQLNEDPDLFKLVVRRWIKQSDTPSIPVYKLETFYQQARQAGNDHNVSVRWGGWLLRLYKQQLWLHTDSEILPCPALKWTEGDSKIDLGSDIGELVLKGAGETEPPAGDRPGTIYQAFPDGEFSVGARSNIEETAISQGNHHKSLKNLFQMAGIPPWLRDCIPLCKLEGELVALGDWCFDEQFAVWMANNKLSLCWYPNNPLLQYIVKQHQREVDPAGRVR